MLMGGALLVSDSHSPELLQGSELGDLLNAKQSLCPRAMATVQSSPLGKRHSHSCSPDPALQVRLQPESHGVCFLAYKARSLGGACRRLKLHVYGKGQELLPAAAAAADLQRVPQAYCNIERASSATTGF